MIGAAVTRRRFLHLAGGLAGTALPWWSPDVSAQRSADSWRELLRHSQGARAVGRAYLEATPGEHSVEVLVEALSAGLPGGRERVSSLSDLALREALQAAIASDFAEERVVMLEGWVLARTEARLGALAHLAIDPGGEEPEEG